MTSRQDLMDAIAIVSFIIGVANYDENISQSDVQDVVQDAVEEVHQHLIEQDKKIDLLLAKEGIVYES